TTRSTNCSGSLMGTKWTLARRREVSERPHGFIRPKLTLEDAQWIKGVLYIDLRARRARGFKIHTDGLFERIAAKFGISPRTVIEIRKGARWQTAKVPPWAKDHLRFYSINPDARPPYRVRTPPRILLRGTMKRSKLSKSPRMKSTASKCS